VVVFQLQISGGRHIEIYVAGGSVLGVHSADLLLQ
jgi:hypothetical protein